jgi:hypothetical protein
VSDATTAARRARWGTAVVAAATLAVVVVVDPVPVLERIATAGGRRGASDLASQLRPAQVAWLRGLFASLAAGLGGLAWWRPQLVTHGPRRALGGLGDAGRWSCALVRGMPTGERWAWSALLLLVAAHRVFDARLVPMHCDELRTYFGSVARGPVASLLVYDDANNHILHSLMASLSTRMPIPEPLDLRLVSVMASVGSVAVLGLMLRSVLGAFPALTGVAAMLAVPATASQGAAARGYALCLLAALLGALATTRLVQGSSVLRARVLFILSCGLGALTIPVHVYSVLGLLAVRTFFAAVDRDRRAALRTSVDAALSGLVALLGYAGAFLWSGPGALTTQRYVRPLDPLDVLVGVPAYAGRVGRWLLDAEVGRAAIPVLILAAVILFLRSPPTRRAHRCLAALAAAFALAVLVVPVLQRIYPPRRVWGPLAVSFAICIALAADRLRSGSPARTVAGLLITVLAVVGAVHASAGVRARNAFDTHLARVEQRLADGGFEDVYVTSRFAALSLRYHAERRGRARDLRVSPGWHPADPVVAYAALDAAAPPAVIVGEIAVPPPRSLGGYVLAHEDGPIGMWVQEP